MGNIFLSREGNRVPGRPPAQPQDEGIWEAARFSGVAKGAACLQPAFP